MAALVLAAGSAQRFGSTKQVAELGQRPLVGYVVTAAHVAGVDEIVVVVGHDADTVAAAARHAGPVTVVRNPEHATGQASSLRAGLRHLEAGRADVAVVLLADEPGVSAAVIRAVAAAVGESPVARARYDDGAGHPVAFSRRTWARLQELQGDRGARAVLDEFAVVEVRVAGARPRDVDSPADLADIEEGGDAPGSGGDGR